MTGHINNDWMKTIDNMCREANRKFLMLVHNFIGHKLTFEPTNVNWVFYPPNCASKLQSIDQGIVANWKHHYQSGVSKYLIEIMDNDLEPLVITIKDAIDRSVLA